MVAAFDYCLHGKGGAAPSIDTAMHGLVDAAARRPPAPGLRDRAGHRGRRGEADRGVLRRPGGLGALAPPRLPARPGHRGGEARRTRRPSASSWAGTGSPRGARPATRREANSLEIIRAGAGVPRRARRGRAVRRRSCPGNEPLPEAERRAKAAAIFPTVRGPGLHRPAPGRPLHRQRRRARVPLPREARPAGRAGHVLPGPLPAHQGQAAGGGPARRRRPLEETVARLRRAARRLPRRLPGLLRAARRPGLAADARRRPGHRAGARRRDVLVRRATSRPPGWPASSTSTRST